jgi:hypothetical protein
LGQKRKSFTYISPLDDLVTLILIFLQGGDSVLQHQVHPGRPGRREGPEGGREQGKAEGHEEEGQEAQGQDVGQVPIFCISISDGKFIDNFYITVELWRQK